MSVSFKSDILPLFTQTDIDHMQDFGVQLDDYDWMSQPDNASNVYSQVSAGSMPPPGSGEEPWSDEKVQLFNSWMERGYQP